MQTQQMTFSMVRSGAVVCYIGGFCSERFMKTRNTVEAECRWTLFGAVDGLMIPALAPFELNSIKRSLHFDPRRRWVCLDLNGFIESLPL